MYTWIIIKDRIDEGTHDGTMGPREGKYSKEDVLEKGTPFRMFDDDGELYYEGKCLSDEPGSEDWFGPLDDFGIPNAGCTGIQYFENGKWEWL